ncbi:MAG TPA: VOC family protein, partial [Actinoplanes sp.]
MTALHHIGYWVPDLAEAVDRAVETLGIGPFLHVPHVRFDEFRLADGTAITEPAYLDHSAAFAAWGPVVLELAEVHTVDDELAAAYQIDPDRVGHVCWVAEDLQAEVARLTAAGCRLIHTATSGGIAVAWLDGGPLCPHPIEVHRAGPAILGMHGRLTDL